MTNLYNTIDLELLSNERALPKLDKSTFELNARRDIIDNGSGGFSPEDSPQIKLLDRHGVLDRILLYLTDPEDILTAYKVCSAFQRKLGPRRNALINQEQALRITFDKYFKNAYFRDSEELKYILKLRLVSKYTRKIVNKYLFEKPFIKEHFGDDSNFDFHSWRRLHEANLQIVKLRLETVEQVNRAIEVLSESEASADHQYFCKDLIVFEQNDGSQELNSKRLSEFRDKVTELLERLSESVWSFSYFSPDDDNIPDIYRRICCWSSLMPNLKAFHLETKFYRSGTDSVHDVIQTTREFQFPTVLSLRSCAIELGVNQAQQIILAAIIQANPWITRTLLDFRRGTENVLKDVFSPSFRPDTVSILGESIPPELTPARNQWPLKMLQLGLIMGGDTLSTSDLFPILEGFRDTLAHLDIRGLDLREDKQFTTYLDLPHLKTLRIRLNAKFHKLDFILPMKSLEVMLLNCRCRILCDRDRDHTEKVQFKGLLYQMEESNISKLFPFLNMLEISNTFWGQYIRLRYKRDKIKNLLTLQKET